MRSAALIVVNYKTATLAIAAIRTARAATQSPLSVIVADNSVDASESAALQPFADVLLTPDRNLGYAAAINLARKSCTAEVLIVSNPDVRFGAGSIDELLNTRAAVAGPALYWDDDEQWLLPPSELQTAGEVFDRALASRSTPWRRVRDRRRIRDRIAFWSLREMTPMRALSGAILAIEASAFDAAGGFDERFHLYFEESDFLRRVEGAVVYVPAARCRHIYNQSAGASADAGRFYGESEAAYLAKWNGRPLARLLKAVERPLSPYPAVAIGESALMVTPGVLIEASPLPAFDTAAGHFARSRRVELPDSIWQAYRSDTLYLRVIEPASEAILATYARSRIGP